MGLSFEIGIMHVELLEILRCPQTRQRLRLVDPHYQGDRVESGELVTEDGTKRYPVRNFVARFAPASNYTDNFGMQWNTFRQTQLDSYSGHPISGKRFWESTRWRPEEIRGQRMLDAGCGAGRFAEIAVQAGARLVALDFSSAVDACFANLKQYPNLDVVQGDIYALPFQEGIFPFVYSIGVLQHTPDVGKAFAALPPMVAPGGRLCVDFYGKRFGTMLHSKYFLRPLTKRVPQQTLFRFLQKTVPIMLPVSLAVGRIPVLGRPLKRFIPVVNYSGMYPLDDVQLREWALLDTFDMLAPEYDQPQSAETVRKWLGAAGLADVEVFRPGHLVGVGRKPS
jgi:SAM-dependent methyltransferase